MVPIVLVSCSVISPLGTTPLPPFHHYLILSLPFSGAHASLLFYAVTAAGTKLSEEATAFLPLQKSPPLLSFLIWPLFLYDCSFFTLRRLIQLRQPLILPPFSPYSNLQALLLLSQDVSSC